MVWISDLQRETLLLVDNLISEGKTYEEIKRILWEDKGYTLRVTSKNGYIPKTIVELCDSKGNYSFVDLRKRRNGLATWETIRIS